MGKKVKLGSPLFDNPFYIECPLAASQAFGRRSGHFVYLDGSRHATLLDSDGSEIFGWALVGKAWTCSATAGADKVTIVTDPYKVWEIPARDTFTAANLITYIGKTCDLEISGGIQYADNGESTDDVLVIVGGDVDEQTLYVHMNQGEMHVTGV